jgi:hypothetical protein
MRQFEMTCRSVIEAFIAHRSRLTGTVRSHYPGLMQESRDEIRSNTLVGHGVVVQGSRPRLQGFYQSKMEVNSKCRWKVASFLPLVGMQCQATFIPVADTVK